MADELRKLGDIPNGGFIPEHLSSWAMISAFMPDVPAVELDLTKTDPLQGKIIIHNVKDVAGDDEQRYYPDALFVERNDEKEICVFDISKHGWDAVECEWHFEQETEKLIVNCKSCGGDQFLPRISWLGYQVFDGENPTAEGSMKYRNSFDSISIDILCLNCGTNECILTAETA